MARHDLPIILFSCLILLAAVGLMGWLVTSGESMDSRYAEYSTLRSDPLGIRAFFEALGSREELTVSRWHERIAALPDGRDKTLFICGANTSDDPKTVLDALNRFVVTGGRVVLTFSDRVPMGGSSDSAEKDEKADNPLPGDSPSPKEEDKAKNKGKPECKSCGGDELGSIEDLWEFKFDSAINNDDKYDSDDDFEVKAERAEESGLPQKFTWYSPLFFVPSSGWWIPVYHWRKDEPGALWRNVVMERALGQGSVVLCSEPYLLSNEAMANNRSPEFLAWLVGGSHTVLFDETHLGVSYRPGIAHLLRRYRLQGLLGVLIVLAFLFIWKNATSLLPRRKHERITDDSLRAGDSLDALANLLRTHTPRSALLPTCVEEWRKLHGQAEEQSGMAGRWEQIMTLAGHSRTDLAETYNKIASLLSERSSPGERRN